MQNFNRSSNSIVNLTELFVAKTGARWYPRGKQKLVSTYELTEPPFRIVLAKFQICGGREAVLLGSQNSRGEILGSLANFNILFGGGVILDYSWLGYSWIFEHRMFSLKIWSAQLRMESKILKCQETNKGN